MEEQLEVAFVEVASPEGFVAEPFEQADPLFTYEDYWNVLDVFYLENLPCVKKFEEGSDAAFCYYDSIRKEHEVVEPLRESSESFFDLDAFVEFLFVREINVEAERFCVRFLRAGIMACVCSFHDAWTAARDYVDSSCAEHFCEFVD